MKDVKDKVVCTIISLFIAVVVLLAISGKFVPAMIAVFIALSMRKIFTSERGRKWWRKWCRAGFEFDRFFQSKVK